MFVLTYLLTNSKLLMFQSGNHLVGTCRMGYNPATNDVVDSEVRKKQAINTKIKIKYTFFYIFYLIGALILFSYGFYIAYHAHRYIGFLMCFSLTLYGLSRAFFYHFWVYQIQQKKLGLTLKDWLHHYILNPR